MGLFSKTVDMGLNFVRASSKTEMVPTVDAQLINSLCSTFVSLLDDAKLDLKSENYMEAAKEVVANLYVFCFVWSIGASLDESVWDNFDDLVREGFDGLVKLPPNGDVHDFYVKFPENQLTNWKEMVPDLV
jgi:dynein heavy chain